jgi:hypothetical protein
MHSMNRQYPHLGLFVLAALAWPGQPAPEAVAADSPACAACVELPPRPFAPVGQTEQPGLRQAGLLPSCALGVELRQPGVKAWLAHAGCTAVGNSGAWVSRPGTARATPLRPRLHTLLCVLLI